MCVHPSHQCFYTYQSSCMHRYVHASKKSSRPPNRLGPGDTPPPFEQNSAPPNLALLFAILAPRCRNISQEDPKNTILEPLSSKMDPKILPRQPPGPSGGGPNPQKTTKSVGVLVVFTLRPFLQGSPPR